MLFVCGRNRLRSPTAEQVFSSWPGIAVESAGLNRDASQPVTPELLEWADLVFVMEETHRRKLSLQFGAHLKAKRIVCLDIRDEFRYMDPALVEMLKQKVSPFLKQR